MCEYIDQPGSLPSFVINLSLRYEFPEQIGEEHGAGAPGGEDHGGSGNAQLLISPLE
jgi:hypothetical protein